MKVPTKHPSNYPEKTLLASIIQLYISHRCISGLSEGGKCKNLKYIAISISLISEEYATMCKKLYLLAGDSESTLRIILQ